jgi:3-hexulose-6-phosphate synthase
MKLQISYNLTNLTTALELAQQTAEYADILGVGALLIFKEGIKAIKLFKTTFPNKEISAEIALSEKANETVGLFANAGASYVSVLAGAYHRTIKKAVEACKTHDIKLSLDLLDAHSAGQSAMDAKAMGVSTLILHRTPSSDEPIDIFNEWQNVRDNTMLPVFITGKIDRANIQQIIDLKPQGIIIGTAITKADDPVQEAKYFKSLL